MKRLPQQPARSASEARSQSSTPLYAHDEVLRIVGCLSAYNSSGVLTETRHGYFSDQWQIVREMVSGSTATLYIWGLRYIDELLVRYDPTFGRQYAMQDANFNCTAICDDALSSGTVDERYQYDPYAGNRVILDSSWNVIPVSAYNWTVGHQGLMFETEVGIYNCRNRVYLPMMGVWMQRDPLGYADGGNLYEYVGSNPEVRTDSTGGTSACDWSRSECFHACWVFIPYYCKFHNLFFLDCLLYYLYCIFSCIKSTPPETSSPHPPSPPPRMTMDEWLHTYEVGVGIGISFTNKKCKAACKELFPDGGSLSSICMNICTSLGGKTCGALETRCNHIGRGGGTGRSAEVCWLLFNTLCKGQ